LAWHELDLRVGTLNFEETRGIWNTKQFSEQGSLLDEGNEWVLLHNLIIAMQGRRKLEIGFRFDYQNWADGEITLVA